MLEWLPLEPAGTSESLQARLPGYFLPVELVACYLQESTLLPPPDSLPGRLPGRLCVGVYHWKSWECCSF